MNMHAALQHTPAETAILEAFAERFSDLPGDGAVVARRDDAVELLKAGLPTRRIEAWHYTDLRRLLTDAPAFDPTLEPRPARTLLEGASVLAVLNGAADKARPIEGADYALLRDGLLDGSVADALGSADPADTIGALNTAFVSDGHEIRIAAGAVVEPSIELQNIQAGGQAHARFRVAVGDGAKATFVERQTGTGAALVTSVSELELGDGAEVIWLIVQEQPDDATHLAQFKARLGADSRLTLFFMNAGAKLVRQEIRVEAAGERADFQLRGVNLLSGDTHADVTMILNHLAPGTTSSEVIRNVVTDRARGVFQGQIRVAREAQKTDAKMACNTLLLSDDGEFSAKPELEIFADDVACGHGATVTEIDRSHLFYLMARGVPEKEARGLLVKAFLAEVIEELDLEPAVAALEEKLDAWFGQHG